MSRYKLTGSEIEIIVEEKGAELVSIREISTDREYMWNADPAFWGKTSPILFPVVGGLKNGQYQYQGKTFTMNMHGFARGMKFNLMMQSTSELWFELTSDAET